MAELVIDYTFQGAGGISESFPVKVDAQTMVLIHEPVPEPLPEWTKLDFLKCSHCPLNARTTPHCPVARSLIRVAVFSNRFRSYDKLAVKVTTEDRTIIAKTTAQTAFGSLIGLMIATSGCPHTDYLKPMARFHLPLSSVEETIYRVFSMYLLAQYFRSQKGGKPDQDFSGLKQLYENIEIVNVQMTERLRAATRTDASLNAVICLDTLAKTMLSMIEDKVDEVRYLFDPYLK